MAQGYIYKFTLEKEEEKKVEVERKNKETGEKETILKPKKVKTPVNFVVNKPSRRLIDEAEAQYAIELSKNIKKGIITKNMLVKKYADTGGQLTENEAKDMVRKLQKSNEISNEIQLLNATDKKANYKKIKNLEVELLNLRQELADIEMSMQGVYGHTADARAERSMLLWYTINLSKIVEDEEEKPFFNGILYEDQLEDLYQKDENGDPIEQKALQNFMAAISYWFYNNSAEEEDVKKFIEDNQKNVK
tara:strand:+ start:2631 stop:3374 length:744 start_codon:yes stop_codon:yes gene_type:complete